MNGILCHCNTCPGVEDYENGTCYLKPGGQCFSAVEEMFNRDRGEFEPVRTFGCFSQSDQALLQCRGDLVPSYYGRSIKCCNFTDLCNKDLFPQYKPRARLPPTGSFFENNLHFFALLGVIVVGFLILLSYVAFLFYKHKKKDGSRKYLTKTCNIKLQKSHNILPDCISSSGSGVGNPLLIRTTISRQIKRTCCLGRGRFTEVYLGDLNAGKIVEKVFSTTEEERWLREKQIYETALLRHANILGYISSDILDTGLRAIYTDYHANGSLYNYLSNTHLNYVEFFLLVKSAATGIAQLHTEILGTLKRPAVAHCDITSKNFLINSRKECVISNFEIAIMHISTEDNMKMEPDITLATPRYMAPEVTCASIDTSSFESFKMADIYSLGLVFYEICQRCATVDGNRYTVEDHTLPFSNVLPKNPSIEDMKRLYEAKKSKKDLLFIPSRWENDTKVLKPFLTIMRECLYENPKARPTALRLWKSIVTLVNSNAGKDVDIL